MGQTITSLIDSLQNQAEKEKLANDTLNSLVEMAKLQKEQFFLTILSEAANVRDIPINKVIARDSILQAMTSDKPGDVGKIISDDFNAFASGDVAAGISKLIAGGMKILLGSFSGNISTRDQYIITTGALGGITRIDMHFFAYRYTASQLTEIAKQVIGVSLVVSSVDAGKLDDGTLRNIVQIVYGTLPADDQKKILNQLKAAARDEQQPNPQLAAIQLNKAVRAVAGIPSPADDQPSPPPTVTLQQEFSVTFPIGQAAANAPTMESYLRGGLVEAFNHDPNGAELYELSVICKRAEDSISDTVVSGEVSVVRKSVDGNDDKVFLQTVLKDLLTHARNQAISPLVLTSFDVPED
ncbi:hypothetical protein PMIN06_010259 [Paraphaeosphaeria minitans]|uniref:Uncharacterized protein n=1 Tax=Paraphaeosphaeria minitans TaxID=565426 RepID=A0A9P6GHV5_9PLEO|nr:hypothetical protein PMIN01_07079 [Paraphaeosphaeria minitans]